MASHVKSAPITTITGEWECDECGYYRRGTLRNRPHRCPECGAPADAFTFWSDDDDDDWDDDEEGGDDDDWDDED